MGIRYGNERTDYALSGADKEEKDAQETMLQALEKVGEPLLHRIMPYHFTVSALVLNPEMNRVLMVHHNLFGTFTWPGGHTDGETDLLAVALREVREETGVGAVYPLSGAPLSLDLLSCPAHVKMKLPVPGAYTFLRYLWLRCAGGTAPDT